MYIKIHNSRHIITAVVDDIHDTIDSFRLPAAFITVVVVGGPPLIEVGLFQVGGGTRFLRVVVADRRLLCRRVVVVVVGLGSLVLRPPVLEPDFHLHVTLQNKAILDIRLRPPSGAVPWWVSLSIRLRIKSSLLRIESLMRRPFLAVTCKRDVIYKAGST